LPPSAVDTLARLQVDYPMLFQLSSPSKGTMTHSGVLEFTADEGSCYIPFWMMQNLLIEEGTVITVTNVSLPKATFVKLQPQHVDFLEISNPRAFLEHALRNFSCVTKGDVIQVPYNGKNYHFLLKEVKPQNAACIIETDCNVDFDAPLGYQEPLKPEAQSSSSTPVTSRQNSSLDQSFQNASTAKLSAKDSSQDTTKSDDTNPENGIRIIDGNIIRPSESATTSAPLPSMLADKIGTTGVQRNAAIPVLAPKVDYWAIQAGSGSRLDGKSATTVLKDATGAEYDMAQLRAEAAAKRAVAATESSATSLSSDGSASTLKRNSKVAGKYSKLKPKAATFQGSGNRMK
jgi:ubiquitin fusion degradation protein 1